VGMIHRGCVYSRYDTLIDVYSFTRLGNVGSGSRNGVFRPSLYIDINVDICNDFNFF